MNESQIFSRPIRPNFSNLVISILSYDQSGVCISSLCSRAIQLFPVQFVQMYTVFIQDCLSSVVLLGNGSKLW